jgi:hypothetical protein
MLSGPSLAASLPLGVVVTVPPCKQHPADSKRMNQPPPVARMTTLGTLMIDGNRGPGHDATVMPRAAEHRGPGHDNRVMPRAAETRAKGEVRARNN